MSIFNLKENSLKQLSELLRARVCLCVIFVLDLKQSLFLFIFFLFTVHGSAKEK